MKKATGLFIFIFMPFLIINVFGQKELSPGEYIGRRFREYCLSTPWEEIFIHNDRSEYISGEKLWFTVYLFDRQTMMISSESSIVYFEILNPENKPILKKKVLMQNGCGPGMILLPDTLSSGSYTLLAYTSWMKNFMPDNCFKSVISIYNPVSPEVYRTRIDVYQDDDTLKLKDKPGITMKVNNTGKDTLEISVKTDEQFRITNGNRISLLIQAHGNITLLSDETLKDEISVIHVPRHQVLPGINQIIIFDNTGPASERFVFVPAVTDSPQIYVSAPDSAGKRSKIEIELDCNPGNPQPAFLSASVSLSSNSISDMSDYLIFGSEFGNVIHKKLKNRKISDIPASEIDSMLLSVRSNWINWESVFSSELAPRTYNREKEYYYLNGRLLDNKFDPAGEHEAVSLSMASGSAYFQYAEIDKKGHYSFMIDIDDKVKDVIIEPVGKKGGRTVLIEPAFSYQLPLSGFRVDRLPDTILNKVTVLKMNFLINKLYNPIYIPERPHPVNENYRDFYGKPDIRVYLKDYIELDSMPEVFFELLHHVNLIKNRSVYEISIPDEYGKILDGDPCIMINGIIMSDLSVIASINPRIVERIDLVRSLYRVGDYLFHGIINIVLKADISCDDLLPADIARQVFTVYDYSDDFNSADYSSGMQTHSADYRNTLFWAPEVVTDKTGKAKLSFWSGDNKDNFVIDIQGISHEGKIMTFRKSIKIN